MIVAYHINIYFEQAKECAGQKNGFVTFKKSLRSKIEEYGDENNKQRKSSSIKIPQHLRQKMNEMNQATRAKSAINNPKPTKTSKELRSEADKLRAEIAALKQKSQMLVSKST